MTILDQILAIITQLASLQPIIDLIMVLLQWLGIVPAV